jgi:hypothetical protein
MFFSRGEEGCQPLRKGEFSHHFLVAARGWHPPAQRALQLLRHGDRQTVLQRIGSHLIGTNKSQILIFVKCKNNNFELHIWPIIICKSSIFKLNISKKKKKN